MHSLRDEHQVELCTLQAEIESLRRQLSEAARSVSRVGPVAMTSMLTDTTLRLVRLAYLTCMLTDTTLRLVRLAYLTTLRLVRLAYLTCMLTDTTLRLVRLAYLTCW